MPKFKSSKQINIARNEFIRANRLFVIDENGEKLGEMDKFAAVKLAQERDLDLIEVAPNANPPVAKIFSWSKYKYQVEKKRKGSKTKSIEQKEMWFNAFIDKGDLDHKIKKTKDFLAKKHLVKLTIRGKGRINNLQMRELLDKILSELSGSIEQPEAPKFEGRNLTLLVQPVKHKTLIETQTIDGKQAQNSQSDTQKI